MTEEDERVVVTLITAYGRYFSRYVRETRSCGVDRANTIIFHPVRGTSHSHRSSTPSPIPFPAARTSQSSPPSSRPLKAIKTPPALTTAAASTAPSAASHWPCPRTPKSSSSGSMGLLLVLLPVRILSASRVLFNSISSHYI